MRKIFSVISFTFTEVSLFLDINDSSKSFRHFVALDRPHYKTNKEFVRAA